MIHVAHGERLETGVKGLHITVITFKEVDNPDLMTRVKIKQIKEDGNYRAILNFNVRALLLNEFEVRKKLIDEFAGEYEGSSSNRMEIHNNWQEALEWLESLVTMFGLSEGMIVSDYKII